MTSQKDDKSLEEKYDEMLRAFRSVMTKVNNNATRNNERFLKIENSIQLLQSKPSMAETAYKNEEEELKKRKNKVDNDLKSIEAKLVDIDRLITTQDEKIKAYKQYIDRKKADTKVYIPQSSNKNEFTCKMCEHSFKSKYVLGKHMKSEHPLNIKCSYCDSTFEATIELEKHMHELHGTKALKCNQCEATFFQSGDLISTWRCTKVQSYGIVIT